MTLHQKQAIFAQQIARLIRSAAVMGYEVALGEAYRTPEQAALDAAKGSGIKNSLHTRRLAMDLMLFKNGVFLTDSADYEPLGRVWESMSTPEAQCCWGGRFHKPDGDHFSIADGGQE